MTPLHLAFNGAAHLRRRFCFALGSQIAGNLAEIGLGKRFCVGEALGKVELFHFLASTYQRFSVELEDPGDANRMEPTVGFLLMPPDLSVVFRRRGQAEEETTV